MTLGTHIMSLDTTYPLYSFDFLPSLIMTWQPCEFSPTPLNTGRSKKYAPLGKAALSVPVLSLEGVLREWRCSCTHSFPRHKNEVSGQFNAPAALSRGKEPLVPIGYEAGWALGPVWMRW